MAELRVHGSDTVLTDPEQIKQFVGQYGLDYEFWNIDKLADDNEQSGESEQERVLRVFAEEIAALKERGGYQSADVIALHPETPNLDTLLAKFDKEHLHTEDEVRFVVDGRGVFTIHGEDDKVFDVEVHPGDLLVVPTDTWHWFTLCEDRTIKCIRIFESTEGWTPVYREEGAAQ
ncbi:unnamed protein product [Laminaria digitata]